MQIICWHTLEVEQVKRTIFIYATRWLPVLSWTCHALKAAVKSFLQTRMSSGFWELLTYTRSKIWSSARPWPKYDLQHKHFTTSAFQLHKALPRRTRLVSTGCSFRWCLDNLRCPAACVRFGISSAFQKPPWWEVNQTCSIPRCEITHSPWESFRDLLLELLGLVGLGLVCLVLFFFFISAVLCEHLGERLCAEIVIRILYWDATDLHLNTKPLVYTHSEIVAVATTPADRSAVISPL